MNRTLHMTRAQLEIRDELADWIDVLTLSSEIIDALYVHWPQATLDRCKELWLRALYNLPEFLQQESKWLPDPANEE